MVFVWVCSGGAIGRAFSKLRGFGLGYREGLGSWGEEGGSGSNGVSESPFSEPSGVQWQVPSK